MVTDRYGLEEASRNLEGDSPQEGKTRRESPTQRPGYGSPAGRGDTGLPSLTGCSEHPSQTRRETPATLKTSYCGCVRPVNPRKHRAWHRRWATDKSGTLTSGDADLRLPLPQLLVRAGGQNRLSLARLCYRLAGTPLPTDGLPAGTRDIPGLPRTPAAQPCSLRAPAQVQVPAPPGLLPEPDSLPQGSGTPRATLSCAGDTEVWSQYCWSRGNAICHGSTAPTEPHSDTTRAGAPEEVGVRGKQRGHG